MGRSSTPAEIRDRILAAIPGDAGEIFFSLTQRTIEALNTWQIFLSLYAFGKERIQLLQEVDYEFFLVIRFSLRDHIRLQLAKLLDPARTLGHRNASLEGFLQASEAILPGSLRAEITSDIETVRGLFESSGIRNARNQLIAHSDLETIKGSRTIAGNGLYNSEFDSLFAALTRALNAVELHYLKSETVYDLQPAGHAMGLISWLERAKRSYDEERMGWRGSRPPVESAPG